MSRKPERPATGGSYLRQKGGALKRTGGTAPAPGRPNERPVKAATKSDDAPAAVPAGVKKEG